MNAPTSSLKIPAPPARSVLVTVLGWIAIALGTLTVVAALSQFQFFGNLGEIPSQMDPAVQQGLSRSFQGVALLNVALAGFLMYAGYALWKRRNWARRTFIVLFALGVVANVIWVAISALFGSMLGQLGAAYGAMFAVFAILALGVAGLFYWFIKRLRSPAVKSEFA
jgi:hypothetical protein